MTTMTLIKCENGYIVNFTNKGKQNNHLFLWLDSAFTFIAQKFEDEEYIDKKLQEATQENEPITSDSLTV
jgi:hypothetical protein